VSAAPGGGWGDPDISAPSCG